MLREDAIRQHEQDVARIEELADRYEDLRGKYDTLVELHGATMRALKSTLRKLAAFDAWIDGQRRGYRLSFDLISNEKCQTLATVHSKLRELALIEGGSDEAVSD